MVDERNLPDRDGPRMVGHPPRGRPRGSISLTPEIERIILAYIRAGAFSCVAARAAGISERTLSEWIARGEGRHPSRTPTRKLKRFAREVRIAQAEARIGAEIRVYRDKPSQWLKYAARTKDGMDGWSEPLKGADKRMETQGLLESWMAELDAIDAMEEARRRVGVRFGCGQPCACPEHEGSVDDERRRILGEDGS